MPQAPHCWLLSLGSLMEAMMAVGSGSLRKLVLGWASLGGTGRKRFLCGHCYWSTKKEAGFAGSPASIKMEQKPGKQVQESSLVAILLIPGA